VLQVTEAARERVRRVAPRRSQTAVIIKAKLHGSNVRLRTGREFLGLGTDLAAGSPIFIASSPGASVHQMLSHRHRSGHFGLIPGSAQENELRSRIATRLRDYLARHPSV